MPVFDSDQSAPPKRMRLGTRSCVECRRRKVRCVFQEPSAICNACQLHGVPCHSQQPASVPRAKQTTASLLPRAREEGTSAALMKRLDEMENMIKQIRSSGTSNGGTPILAIPDSLASGAQSTLPYISESSVGFQPPSTSTSTPDDNQASSLYGTDISPRGASDALETFGNTPLVSFFREALSLPRPGEDGLARDHTSLATSPAHLSNGPSLLQPLPASNFTPKLLLSDSCLHAVLEVCSPCFSVFPPCSFYQPPPTLPQAPSVLTPQLNTADVAAIFADIHAALWSDNAEAAAKALLWVCICVFQLPRAWASPYPELANTQSLIEAYRRQAGAMLAMAAETGECSRHTVEARCLEVKLNVDLGFPRKAWLSARQAVSACFLLAYHRATRQDMPHEQSLWQFSLHSERETSMILGMPSSVSNENKGLLPVLPPDENQMPPAFRLLHEIVFLLGSLSDQYQALTTPPPPGSTTDNLSATYAATIQLDQEWEAIKRFMPDDFWQEDRTSAAIAGLQPVDLYIRQTTKIRYYILGRHIHLPYALRAHRDRRYTYSRTACLEASRHIIQAYQTLRHVGGEQWSPCGLQDFESFSAAMVIALTMLQDSTVNPGRTVSERSHLEQEDYSLLQDLSLTLRKTHIRRGGCSVAQRAADAMDVLLPLLQGQYQCAAKRNADGSFSTADQDITVPFFGRLRVKFPHYEAGPSPESSLSSPQGSTGLGVEDLQMACTEKTAQMSLAEQPPLALPMIEFGVPYCNLDFHLNFDCDLELNSDWMDNAGSGMYDWTTLFAPAPK